MDTMDLSGSDLSTRPGSVLFSTNILRFQEGSSPETDEEEMGNRVPVDVNRLHGSRIFLVTPKFLVHL